MAKHATVCRMAHTKVHLAPRDAEAEGPGPRSCMEHELRSAAVGSS